MENAAASLEYFVACLDASKWVCCLFYDNKEQIFCNKGGQELQGCQIFLGIKYQNWKKYTKLPRTVPNVDKI
jgi:hypothetical protein